jgi:hypothetical protein
MADKTGSCLCGVAFEITGLLGPVIACHCHQCRKQTGAYLMNSSGSPKHAASKWYRSSDTGRRGFCEQCGSVLFWKGDGYDYIAIAAGSIDGKLGVTLGGATAPLRHARTFRNDRKTCRSGHAVGTAAVLAVGIDRDVT